MKPSDNTIQESIRNDLLNRNHTGTMHLLTMCKISRLRLKDCTISIDTKGSVDYPAFVSTRKRIKFGIIEITICERGIENDPQSLIWGKRRHGICGTKVSRPSRSTSQLRVSYRRCGTRWHCGSTHRANPSRRRCG